MPYIIEQRIRIDTRKGKEIRNEPAQRMLPTVVENKDRALRKRFPDAIRAVQRQPANGIYNCHGLTFLVRRAWLTEDAELDKVIADDGYADVALNQLMPGDVVVYYGDSGGISHTGIVIRIDDMNGITVPWVLSKWGDGGEYLHPFNYCPYHPPHADCPRIRYMREGLDV
jgi:hypothetical protein